MLMDLLSNQGSSSVEEVAKKILLHDKSQVDYYSNITITFAMLVIDFSTFIAIFKPYGVQAVWFIVFILTC